MDSAFGTHQVQKINKKGERLFALSVVVGADGVEPPTYAL
jgi:hypothetical protein